MTKATRRSSENPLIRLVTDYNLSLVLFSLFVLSWIGQLVSQVFEFRNEANAHGEALSLGEFMPAFLVATFENWQSEFLQLFTFVVLTSFLIHRGSHESKDEGEEIIRKLDEIQDRLREMKRMGVG